MSIAERKNKEKEEMSKRILDGARKVFLKNGYEQTSIRNIADEINYSPGTLYFYFKDKGEIFNKLHEEGFRLLLAKCRVLDNVEDPFQRLKALGRTFIQFATENKDYYNLMFLVDETADFRKARHNLSSEAINTIAVAVKQCQEKGQFKGMKTDYLTFMILSTLHGICALFCKDRTKNFREHTTEELMTNGYDYFIRMLEKA